MRWRTLSPWLAIFIVCCSQRFEKVEKRSEDGVEVVMNPLEPYRIEGEPAALALEEERVIDLEDPEIVNQGLSDLRKFDVDSRGNIYIFQMPHEGAPLVFKLNPSGKLVSSFGQVGQGPGEVQFPSYQRIKQSEEIWIWDSGALKLVVFDLQGVFLGENRLELKTFPVGSPVFLDNGGFLARESMTPEGERTYDISINLYDSGLKKLKELERYRILVPQEVEKVSAYPDFPVVGISEMRVYTGRIGPEYEISTYGLDGRLMRKCPHSSIFSPMMMRSSMS